MESIPVSDWSLNRRPLSAPVTVNLELTTGCNLKCRHCYNFWREDPSEFKEKFDLNQIDRIIDRIIESNIYHVVLSGGEPMMNFNVLEHALIRIHDAGLTSSVNSNLMRIDEAKAKRLANAGLDHILTSVYSADVSTNDFMMNKPGALGRVKKGIDLARNAGIRVSANMVISEPNNEHVLDTGYLCKEAGIQKLFATRLVPAVTVDNPTDTELELTRESARKALDQLMRVKQEVGLEVGTLISYPLCFLSDLNRYQEIVGRGCPSQTGNRMVINADGSVHICTHEEKAYGNVFEEAISGIFSRAYKWHDGSYHYEGCTGCPYQMVCSSGCRMAAEAYYGDMAEKDPLYVGYENIEVPFYIELPKVVDNYLSSGGKAYVPERVRFREEPGYSSINVRWANTFAVPGEVASALRGFQQEKVSIGYGDLPNRDVLYLLYKDALVLEDTGLQSQLDAREKTGASVNPYDLPDGFLRLV